MGSSRLGVGASPFIARGTATPAAGRRRPRSTWRSPGAASRRKWCAVKTGVLR